MSALTGILEPIVAKLQDLNDEIERARRVVASASDEAIKAAEPFVGKREAARFLNMAVCTLEERMREDADLPRYIDGGKINFRLSELLAWRRQWRVGQPAQEQR